MLSFIRNVLFFSFFSLIAFSAKGQVVAGFTADVTSGCAPLVVHFTNTSTGATSYFWSFGDASGTTSTLTDASCSYLTPGTYTCTLTASNGGSSSTSTVTITVFPAPTVSFTAPDTAACPGATLSFSSTSTLGVPGTGTYLWVFGDGGPTANTADASHTFANPGYYNITLSVTNADGCVTSLTKGAYVHIYTPPVAAFSATSAYFCHAPGHAVFNNISTGTAPLSYVWNFGDGSSTSTDANPTHDYSSPGSYPVTLTVTDGHGCVTTITVPNYIFVGNITANFTGASTACVFTPVTFTNTSSTHISSSWSFGDGGSSTADNGTHTYSAPGTYTVTLVVFDGHCYDTVSNTITILPEPTGTFSWTPTNPCPGPATISFSGTGPTGATYSWLFGDGGTGTGANPSHTYGGDGADSIKMVITDASGCKDTVTRVDTLYNLVFDFSHDMITSGCKPLTINFLTYDVTTSPDSSSHPYPYGVASYTWHFGDGSPAGSGATPSHTYTAEGTYTATVNIVTGNGCLDSALILIHVGRPPVAYFTATTTHICADREVHFVVADTTAPDTSYVWIFGDKSGDTGPDPYHLYTTPGVFTDTLIASYNGCPDTFIRPLYITVDSPYAIIDDTFICSPRNNVAFVDSSLGDDSHVWIFGDGSPNSTADYVVHSFPSISMYTVKLATYNIASGCRDTAKLTLNLVAPVPTFVADDTAVCIWSIINFTAIDTTGSGGLWSWFINGVYDIYGAGTHLSDTFKVPGLYTIAVAMLDAEKCVDTFSRTNYIIVAKPVDSFEVLPPTGCWPLTVNFVDHSTDVPGAVLTNWNWTFGDASTPLSTTSTSIFHTYTTAGTFGVTEIVTDNIGCKDTLVKPALISVYKPTASFFTTNTYPCIGTSIHFTNISTGIVNSFWNFGDGDTVTATSPDHAYTAPGVYTVTLVVTDVHGCTDTTAFTGYINVTRPVASFYMDDSFTICPPLLVNFFNTSTGASAYQWYFGDGASSVAVSPNDLYTSPGYDTVLLIATNSHGCKDTAYGHTTIYGYAGAFSYSPDTGCGPLTVHFTSTISNVPSIIWDFSDGTVTSPSAVDSATHTYTVPGAYVPKLILSDNTGCSNSSLGIDTIKVEGITPGFKWSPACLDQPVTFTDTSKGLFAAITGWHWTLLPGDTSDASSPSATYDPVGTYPVSLVVKDAWGCTDSITENIIINGPPTITVSPDTTICLGDAAVLEGYGGVSYTWAPAATVSCSNCNPTNASPTVVTVYTVTGADINGCTGTDTVRISLKTKTVSMAFGDTAICREDAVTLLDTGATKFTWIPSAGLSSTTIANPIASPDTTTTYMVIAQLASCIADTNYVTIVVYQLPTVDAGPDQTLVAGSTAQLNAIGTLIDTYEWSPANSLNCSTCVNPVASMAATTTYTVTVTSVHACRAVDTVTIHLFCDKGQVFIPNSFTPNGDGQNDVFYPRGTGISNIKSFRIYNRWGELLFERENIPINDEKNAWDGSYKGSSPKPDVYVYIVDAICDTGEPINFKGDVTIIR